MQWKANTIAYCEAWWLIWNVDKIPGDSAVQDQNSHIIGCIRINYLWGILLQVEFGSFLILMYLLEIDLPNSQLLLIVDISNTSMDCKILIKVTPKEMPYVYKPKTFQPYLHFLFYFIALSMILGVKNTSIVLPCCWKNLRIAALSLSSMSYCF